MRHYGFNFVWMFIWRGQEAPLPDERALDFLAAHEFNFVSVPTDYRFWTKDFDYLHPNEDVWKALDRYLESLSQSWDSHVLEYAPWTWILHQSQRSLKRIICGWTRSRRMGLPFNGRNWQNATKVCHRPN
jgi:hypothetical protein